MSRKADRARNLVVAAGVLLAAAAPAMATPFDLAGVNDPNLTAHVMFAYDGIKEITITIQNTSLLEAGADSSLTAFAFNAPLNVTGVSLSTVHVGWTDSFDRNAINTPGQFGLYDIAGITGPNFNGGSAAAGIERGHTFMFSFQLTGTGLNLLDESSFLNLLSEPGPGNPSPQYFVARFQSTGSDGEGSDVAIPAPVPEPGSLLLLGAGLSALGFFRRRS